MGLFARYLQKKAATPALSELISEPWLDLPERVEASLNEVVKRGEGMTASDIRSATNDYNAFIQSESENPKPFQVTDRTAIVSLSGHLLKTVPSALWFTGIAATSTIETRRILALIGNDTDVDEVALVIDSPGGQVAGTDALARAVAELNQTKPVHVFVPDLAASAALWIATQGSSITAGPTAIIGSIGAYTIINDVSEAFKKNGIKTHVISSGDQKGAFAEGAPIKPEHLKRQQELINEIRDMFVGAVAEGRAMEVADVMKLATGDVWHAEAALELGLIDMIGTEDEFMGLFNRGARADKHDPEEDKRREKEKEDEAGGHEDEEDKGRADEHEDDEDEDDDKGNPFAKKKGSAQAISRGIAQSTNKPGVGSMPIDIAAFVADLNEADTKQVRTLIDAKKEDKFASLPPDIRKQLADNTAEIAALKADNDRDRYLTEANALPFITGVSTVELAEILANADQNLDPKVAKRLRTQFAVTNAALEKSGMFVERGSIGSDGAASPLQQLNGIATTIANDEKVTFEDAFIKACERNPVLYNAHNGLED